MHPRWQRWPNPVSRPLTWTAASATAKPVADYLTRELGEIVNLPDVRSRFAIAGLVSNGAGADQANARLKAYLDKFALAVKVSGYQPD
jgi:hypothetical protein